MLALSAGDGQESGTLKFASYLLHSNSVSLDLNEMFVTPLYSAVQGDNTPCLSRVHCRLREIKTQGVLRAQYLWLYFVSISSLPPHRNVSLNSTDSKRSETLIPSELGPTGNVAGLRSMVRGRPAEPCWRVSSLWAGLSRGCK